MDEKIEELEQDNASSTLASGYPEKLFNWKGREVCPFCHQKLK